MNKSTQHRNKSKPLIFDNKNRSHLIKTVSVALMIICIFLLVLIYYYRLWGSIQTFVITIDHHQQLFQDFTGHYYPMGKNILNSPTPVYGYFYSAFFALLLVPFGKLELPQAMRIWGIIQILFLAILFTLPLFKLIKLKSLGIALYAIIFATSFPILHNLKWGQVSILIMVCIFAAFHAYTIRWRTVTGILIAFASALKFYPIIFLLYFIIKRDIRVLISFVLTIIVFYVLIPVTSLDFQPWMRFESAVLVSISNADWVARDVNSQYFAHVITRWFRFFLGTDLTGWSILPLIGYIIVIINTIFLWLLQKYKLQNELTLSLVLLCLTLPFIIKTSWPHYFVYLPFCQIMLLIHLKLKEETLKSWRMLLFLFTIGSVFCSSIFIFNFFPNWSIFSSLGMLFIANFLLLTCLYIIILVTIRDKQSERLSSFLATESLPQ